MEDVTEAWTLNVDIDRGINVTINMNININMIENEKKQMKLQPGLKQKENPI
jgi:hypothetical protein